MERQMENNDGAYGGGGCTGMEKKMETTFWGSGLGTRKENGNHTMVATEGYKGDTVEIHSPIPYLTRTKGRP